MKLLSAVAIALAIGSCEGVAPGNELPDETECLRLRVYDQADVPIGILGRALGETSRILAASGIKTVWDIRDANSPENESRSMDFSAFSMDPSVDTRHFLLVRFVRIGSSDPRHNALAFSLPAARYGAHVTVYFDRAEEVSLVVPPRLPKILANILAHEIGHVLLGSGGHSDSGIMKAVWTRADYQRIAAEYLKFLPQEAVAMRNEVSRRAALSSVSRP